MRVRVLLTAGVVAAASLTAVADAAPKRSCNLIVDVKADANDDIPLEGGQKVPDGFPASESLDLVGGDLASNGNRVTAVIKLAKFDAAEQRAIGRRYILQFQPAGSKYPIFLAALFDSSGEAYTFGFYGPSTSSLPTNSGPTHNHYPAPTGAVVGNEIRISATMADLASVANVGRFAVGKKISGLTAYSQRRTPYRSYEADSATSKAVYVAGAPSCVVVGN